VPRKRNLYEAMVVPIPEDTFAAARKLHVFAVPIRKRASDVTYIAFYRGPPTSAITHYAKVTSIEKNVAYEDAFPKGSALITQQTGPLKLYHLDELVQFRRKVLQGRNKALTKPEYADLKTLRKARYLDEVWSTIERLEPSKIKAKAKTAKASAERKPQGKGRKRTSSRQKQGEEAKGPKASAKTTTGKAVEEKTDSKSSRKRRKRSSRGKKKTTDGDVSGPSKGSPTVHYIVDGSNVAMEARTFKEGGLLNQIVLIVDKLAQVKGSSVTVIVDANLRHHVDRKDDLETMINDREVLQAPAQTDADEFILMTAEAHRSRGEEVLIVSNDRYQDYIKKYKPRFDWIRKAQRQFMFVFSPDGSEVIEAMITLS
jgi:hypothetical protein